ncbi:MAG: tetratricopeptide repeat protein, partial [Acidobacteriota bacterium]
MIRKLTYATVAFVALGLTTTLVADTIVLKNGRRIKADHVYEEDTQVTYWTAAGELSLPKSLIDRVIKEDASVLGAPGALAAPSLSDDLLPPLPSEDASATDGQASSSALKNGRINFDYLAKVENDLLRNPNPQSEEKFVKTYYEVTAFLVEQGSLGEASKRARHAAALAPRSLPLAINLGVLLARQQRFSEAVAHLQPAAMKFSDSPEIFMLLGSAYYYTEKMDQAVKAWTRSLELKENPTVREALERAKKERGVDRNYRQSSSGHFLVKYEGAERRALGRDILQTLERHYRDLIRELDYDPPETIIVILYPNQTFGDLTRTPGWVGALNDGKLRIPVSGLSSVTGELSRVLKHELAHSFVQQITQGR